MTRREPFLLRRRMLVLTGTISAALAALLLASLVACRGTAEPLPFYRTATLTPEWLTTREAASPTMHRVAAFRMTDQHRSAVTERALQGKATIVQFFFAACGDVCPVTTTNVARVLAATGADARVQVLSYSVTPERDSVPALQMFANMHGITDARWHLLTGNSAELARLARDSYFVRLGDGATYGVTSIAHTESVVLVDAAGRIRGVYAGSLGLEMQRLREDLETLLRS